LDRQIRFDIHASSGGRWSIHSSANVRAQAISKAKALLGDRKIEAVKVTREGGLSETEEVVFESKSKGGAERPVTITPVNEAPECKELEDFYGFESRKTLGRLLRKYLDRETITASELLYGAGQLKGLCRDEDLINKAIHSIARIQTKGTGEKPHQRVESLYDMVGRITERAEEADNIDEFKQLLASEGLEALVARIADTADENEREYLIHAALAAYIGNARDWERKLDLVLEQAENLTGDPAFVYLDEIIAELFDGGGALKELLGHQRDLADSLQTLAQLSAGTYQAKKRAGPGLKRLNAVRGRFGMPCTSGVMLDRVGREMGGIQPLGKEGGRSEEDAFRELLGDLVASRSISEGAGAVSEAVTLRAKTVLTGEGMDESSEKAIDDVLALLPTPAARFGYLVDLGGTDFGDKNQSLLVARLAAIVKNLKSATDLVYAGAGNSDVILAAAGVRDRLLSTHLPEEWRLRFARKIYDLLVHYKAGEATQTSDGDEGAAAEPKAKPSRKKKDAPVSSKGLSRKTVAAGKYIFREGDTGDEAYLIKSGEVEISRMSGDRDVPIAQVKEGSVIGEMALIDSEPRMASARATKKTVLTIIPKEDLKKRLKRLEAFDPVMHRLMGVMVQRMRNHPIIDA
jgi:hypothetical protein